MAENREDPVEECTLKQEKVASRSGQEEDVTMLRVVSKRSSRGGDAVKWTEEVTRPEKFGTPNDSSEATAGDQKDERDRNRGSV